MNLYDYLVNGDDKKVLRLQKRLVKVRFTQSLHEKIASNMRRYGDKIQDKIRKKIEKGVYVGIVNREDEIVVVINYIDSLVNAFPIIVFKDRKFCYRNMELIDKLSHTSFSRMTKNNEVIITEENEKYWIDNNRSTDRFDLEYSKENKNDWYILKIEKGVLYCHQAVGKDSEMNLTDNGVIIYEPNDEIINKINKEIAEILKTEEKEAESIITEKEDKIIVEDIEDEGDIDESGTQSS